MDKISKSTYIIAAAAFIIIIAAIYFLFIFQKKPNVQTQDTTQAEVKKVEDVDSAKRPFVTLTPTTDGAEIIITMVNMGYFDKIEYELTYLADNPQLPGQQIERGATGIDIDPKAQKYEKQVLLGTGSKGVRSPDKNVSSGKLTLHLFKGETEYRSESAWNLMQAGGSTTVLSDLSSKFKFDVSLGKNYWMIAADTVGFPPQENSTDKVDVAKILRPVYGSFAIAPKFTKPAKVSIVLDQSVQNPTLYLYNPADKSWTKLDSAYDASAKTINTQSSTFGVFVVTSAK